MQEKITKLKKVISVVQMVMGFTMGLYIFTYGPLFYEKFKAGTSEETAIALTTFLMGFVMAMTALLEVITGAIGDAIGRKRAVIWSFFWRVLFFIFLAFVSFSESIVPLIFFALLAMTSFSLAYTFFSGTFTAWCVDSLREISSEVGYEQLLSHSYVYNYLAKVIGGVLGVLFYCYHFPYIGFFLSAFLCVMCIIYCSREMEDVSHLYSLGTNFPSFSVLTQRIGKILKVGFNVFTNSQAILVLVLMFAFYMFVLNIVDYLWPVYLKSNISAEGQLAYWISLVVATQLASAFGAKTIALINYEKKDKNKILRFLLVGFCTATSLSVLVLSWYTSRDIVSTVLLFIVIIIVRFSYGLIAPTYETLLNQNIPAHNSQERATIMSFGSLLRSLIVVAFIIPSGGSSGRSTAVGWSIPAAFLLIAAFIGNRYLSRHQRDTSEVEKAMIE